MRTIGLFKAQSQWPRLLERVERGEEFTITKHGKPVARLVAADEVKSLTDLRGPIDRQDAFEQPGAVGESLAGRNPIDDGRRF